MLTPTVAIRPPEVMVDTETSCSICAKPLNGSVTIPVARMRGGALVISDSGSAAHRECVRDQILNTPNITTR